MDIFFPNIIFNSQTDAIDSLEPYFQKVVNFCKHWENGLEQFEVNTSGSTGVPKTILITRSQAIASIKMTKTALGLNRGMSAHLCLDIESIAGKMMLLRAIEIGMKLSVEIPSKSPLESYQRNFPLDFVAMVPYQMNILLKSPKGIEMLNNTRLLLLGGAPISQELIDKIQNLKTWVYSSYGMTETVSHIALRKLNQADKENCYKKLEGIDLSINSENCLMIRGLVTKNEWITTNDIAELINEEEFIIKGRRDFVVNSGGIKIQIEEIERIVSNYFNKIGIEKRFFLSAIPHPELENELILLLEDKPWAKELQSKILGELRVECPKYKSPKKIFFAEQFKETSSQKIDRSSTLKAIQVLYNL